MCLSCGVSRGTLQGLSGMRQKTIKTLWAIVSLIVVVSMLAWTVGIGVSF